LFANRKHCKNTKAKVNTRSNQLKKQVHTKWGRDPTTLRKTALALIYSAAEYVCLVWISSVHAKKVDVAVNETCRIITGCLKPTSINNEQTIHTMWHIPTRHKTIIAEEKKCNSNENTPRQNNRFKSWHSF